MWKSSRAPNKKTQVFAITKVIRESLPPVIEQGGREVILVPSSAEQKPIVSKATSSNVRKHARGRKRHATDDNDGASASLQLELSLIIYHCLYNGDWFLISSMLNSMNSTHLSIKFQSLLITVGKMIKECLEGSIPITPLLFVQYLYVCIVFKDDIQDPILTDITGKDDFIHSLVKRESLNAERCEKFISGILTRFVTSLSEERESLKALAKFRDLTQLKKLYLRVVYIYQNICIEYSNLLTNTDKLVTVLLEKALIIEGQPIMYNSGIPCLALLPPTESNNRESEEEKADAKHIVHPKSNGIAGYHQNVAPMPVTLPISAPVQISILQENSFPAVPSYTLVTNQHSAYFIPNFRPTINYTNGKEPDPPGVSDFTLVTTALKNNK